MPGNLKSTHTCKQDNCPVQLNGHCLEGLKVEECPYAILLPEDYKVEDNNQIVPVAESKDYFTLFSGEELSEDELTSITYQYPSRLILIIGEPNSGKTTLLASLFDLFQKGCCGDYMFAGSKTQIGFEKRCHLARIVSGQLQPNTERTTSNDFHFLHLAVKNKRIKSQINHLLFADISGERFRMARDHDEEMKQLKILKRADCIFCIADGALLINRKQKQVVKQDLIKLIGRALQNDMISKDKGVNVLITKWDKIVEAKGQDSLESFLIKPLKDRYSNFINGFLQVSARSMTAELKFGIGIDKFLELCVNQFPSPKIDDKPMEFELIREFQKFKYR